MYNLFYPCSSGTTKLPPSFLLGTLEHEPSGGHVLRPSYLHAFLFGGTRVDFPLAASAAFRFLNFSFRH